MSISTTSGAMDGITRNASSPEEQTDTHENPGSELMSLHQLSRTPALSSTKTTLTGSLAEGATVLDMFAFIRFENSPGQTR
jgi:hypothetical protein